MRFIRMSQELQESLDYPSKLSRHPAHIDRLIADGEAQATAFLAQLDGVELPPEHPSRRMRPTGPRRSARTAVVTARWAARCCFGPDCASARAGRSRWRSAASDRRWRRLRRGADRRIVGSRHAGAERVLDGDRLPATSGLSAGSAPGALRRRSRSPPTATSRSGLAAAPLRQGVRAGLARPTRRRCRIRLRLNHVSQFKYTNTMAVHPTYTTHLGEVKDVNRRNDIQLTRDVFYFSGYVFDKRLDYNIMLYTSTADSDRDGSRVRRASCSARRSRCAPGSSRCRACAP